MGWNEIIRYINDNFAQLGVTGLFILETIKLLTSRLNFNKAFSSTVIPIQTSNNVVFNKVAKLEEKLQIATKTVDKLANAFELVSADNATKDKRIETLSNLVVTALAVANVPTSAKESFFNSVVKAKVVTDDATIFLGKMIETKKLQDSQIHIVNDEALKKTKRKRGVISWLKAL